MSETLREALKGKRIGLVLSAGYFGFYGHAGFLQGFERSGMELGAIAGSSAGGLVAGVAAAGLSPERIIELLLELKRDAFWDPDVRGAIWDAIRGGHGPSGLLRGGLFVELLSRHLPVSTFEECSVPLRLIAANLTHKRTEVFRSGALAPRIHATSAYPGLFRAVEIGNSLYWDGGLVDKAPVLVLADEAKQLKLDALLVHYLPSRGREGMGGPWAYAHGLDASMNIGRYDHFQLQLRVLERHELPVYVVISELPPVSPTQLDRGAEAVVAGRAAAELCLNSPAREYLRNRPTSAR